jgi:hypothetical protein
MIGSADSLLRLLHLVRVPDNLDAFNNFFLQFKRNVSRLGGQGMDGAANITCKGDDAHHALVKEDTNVGLLLGEKAVNVDSHLRLRGRGRIDEIKMSVDLAVKDPPQLKRQLHFHLLPTHHRHRPRLKDRLDAVAVTTAAKISGCWKLHVAQGEQQI